jgi:hypothetical protein
MSVSVHEGTDLHRVEVGHAEQQGAAPHVLGGRRDDRPQLDVLLDDRAVEGRAEPRVGHAVTRVLEVGPGPDHLRVGVREPELGGLVLRLGDRLGLVQGVRPLEGGLRVGQLGLRHDEVRVRLRQRIARDARVDRGK